uniref:Uncharacterized protein n=1 Tax=Meloidogyne enterolobii TaxID=390850 RepID=A0A6V7XMJ8_MELEN|nr:unnamed protein product [Meloidogyne enterolobii]
MADDGVVLDDIAMDETAPDAELDEIRKGVSKRKGRGFEGSQKSNVKEYETLGDDGFYGPQRSVEGG